MIIDYFGYWFAAFICILFLLLTVGLGSISSEQRSNQTVLNQYVGGSCYEKNNAVFSSEKKSEGLIVCKSGIWEPVSLKNDSQLMDKKQ